MGLCDQKLPACGQRVKAGRNCSGYRSTADLMFLDESTRVVSQNRRRIASNPAPWDHHQRNTELTKQTRTSTANEAPLKLNGFVMYQPLEDIGVNFFMSNFTVDDPSTSLLHYLPSFYAKSGSTGLGLPQMCTAVGLVSLANRSNSKEMLSVATRKYGAAIRAINAALVCPKRAVQDSERHTEVTIEQCDALVKTVIMNSWTQEIPLPPNFIELKTLVRKEAKSASVYDTFLDLVCDMLQFKQDSLDTTKRDPMALIERASAIDTDMEDFARKLASQAPFESIQLPSIEEASWHTEVTTTAILIQCRSFVPSPSVIAQRMISEALITSQTMEIIASVPQLAGYVQDLEELPSLSRHTAQQNSSFEQESGQRSSYSSSADYNPHSLYHILYQLYIYGSEPCLPQCMKDWIKGRISYMEEKADPLDLSCLQHTVKRQLWAIYVTNGANRYVERKIVYFS
ncbi:hypothetical protein KJE20_07785 [Pyrenophora tritici-repentis]|nr:hypothetical protein KJE20_07785 [Pyrenophora tritici-repentis]